MSDARRTDDEHGAARLRVVVRANVELDPAALGELFRRAWPEHGPPEFELTRSLCWASAHDAERLVGFVNVAWDGGVHAFLLDTVVDPDHQRRGVGRALVRCAAEVARERGARHLHVDFDERQREFYRRCGFRATAAGLLALDEPASDAGRAPALELRRFGAEHAASCRDVLDGLPEWFSAGARDAYLAELPRVPAWVARHEGEPRVAGFIGLIRPQPRALEVHVLAVARDQHGRGVGRALLGHGERFARSIGARFMLVRTLGPSLPDPCFAATRAFYERLGYEPLLEAEALFGTGDPALLLGKAL